MGCEDGQGEVTFHSNQRSSYDTGEYPANCIAIDKSGSLLAVASDDHIIRLYNDLT